MFYMHLEEIIFSNKTQNNHMKKFILMILAIIMVAGLTSTIKAQISVSATQTAGANIVSAISIESDVALNFGNMSVPTDNVSVILSTSHTLTPDKPTKISLLPGTPVTNAHYNVSGAGGYVYSITLPSSPITIKNPGNTTMDLDTFTALTTTQPGANGKLDATGHDTFVVGATLKVQNGQAIGAYTGSFDVIVTYN